MNVVQNEKQEAVMTSVDEKEWGAVKPAERQSKK